MKVLWKTAVGAALLMIGMTVSTAFAETATVTNSDEFAAAMNKYAMPEQGRMSVQSDNSDFSLCRLIVAADNAPDTQNAQNVIYDGGNLYILFFESPAETEAAYYTYLENDEAAVIPDRIVCAEDTESRGSTSSFSHLSWGPQYIGSDVMNDYLLWRYGDTKNMPQVKVAVIDTGIDYTHPFLTERIDVDNGYDFINADRDPMDDNAHGTHVAGIICDNTLNNVTLIPYKVLNDRGKGSLSNTIYAMEAAQKAGADIINFSLASPYNSNGMNTEQKDLFRRIINTDKVAVVAAVGNISDTLPQGAAFPAYIDGVIGVGSCDNQGIRSGSSNYFENMVDITAPGVGIKSSALNHSYSVKNGTSMACPFVSAAAAMLKTRSKAYTPAEIEAMLSDTAADTGTPGYDSYHGSGIIDLTALYDKYFLPEVPSPTPRPQLIHDVSTDNNAVSCSCTYTGQPAYVMIAGYTNGVLQKITYSEMTADGTVKKDFDTALYDSVKIMVWSSLETAVPLCDSYTVK